MRSHQKSTLTLLSSSLLILSSLSASSVEAAEDDRGPRGTIISLGFAPHLGTFEDQSGDRGSSIGGTGALSLTEEVWPRLQIGLGVDIGEGNSQDDRYTVQLFFFGLESSYQLSRGQSGLTVHGGIGLGAMTLSAAEGAPPSASTGEGNVGGSLWRLGLGYRVPLSNDAAGFTMLPRLDLHRVRPQSQSSMSYTMVGLALSLEWASGR